MAGDWIKLQKDTFDKPEVLAIASRLGIDPDAVVGKLSRVWSWFDTHTTDGNAESVTFAFVDRYVGVTGFAEQMALVGWLTQKGHTLSLPNFDYHTGETAKKRALGKNRAEKLRSNAKSNAESNADSVTEALPEKRREEKKEEYPPTPRKRAGGQRFEEFWLSWPKNERKQDKAKCLDHWKRHDLDELADSILSDVRTKRGTTKWSEGFVEAPLVYLRGKRWEDGVTPQAVGGSDVGQEAWFKSRQGIEGKGESVGVGRWDESAFQLGRGESWPEYRSKVFKAAGHEPLRAVALEAA